MQLVQVKECYEHSSANIFQTHIPIEKDSSRILLEERRDQVAIGLCIVDTIVSVWFLEKDFSASIGSERDFNFVDVDQIESSVFLYNEDKFKQLEQLYKIQNIEEVKKFIKSNEKLIPVICDTRVEAEKIFGSDIEDFIIEYNKDYEESAEWLSIIFEVKALPEAILYLLDRFDDEFWLNVPVEQRMKITVIVRPV